MANAQRTERGTTQPTVAQHPAQRASNRARPRQRIAQMSEEQREAQRERNRTRQRIRRARMTEEQQTRQREIWRDAARRRRAQLANRTQDQPAVHATTSNNEAGIATVHATTPNKAGCSNRSWASTSNIQDQDICPPHPGFFKGLCMRCGQLEEEDGSAVAFGYIHKDLRLGSREIDRLRGADLKNLLREKKLVLILDLDHTLLNSTRLIDVSEEEWHLVRQAESSQDDPERSLLKLDTMHMLTKLRPFVHTFLKEASTMFEMYVYTMGERSYALEIVKHLDPKKVYFNSKVISQSDSTQRHQKGLDVVLGAESLVVILDDTEFVWHKHKENLILMERYHFFASSCRQFGFTNKSLSESKQDENESDGALANILLVLKRAYRMFFDPVLHTDLSSRDVRQVLKEIRQEILQGCVIVFSRLFASTAHPEKEMIWKMAEQLGATCLREVDASVTHIVSLDVGTQKSRWALKNNKFLVNPRWIEAANYLWRKQQEKDFPVSSIGEKP